MKIKHSLIIGCLTALLGFGAFLGAGVSREAKVEKAVASSTTDESIMIYFTRPSDWGDNGIRIHTWDENGGTVWASAWLMTWVYNNEYGQGIFAWHPTSEQPLYTNIQFHNDNHGMQTTTLSAPAVSKHFYYNSGWESMDPQTQRIYLYDYDNKFNNGDVKIHSWMEGKNSVVTTKWPGISMSVTSESAGNGRVYYADVYHKYDRVIFNVGGDANKTGTITGMYDNGCYVLANEGTVLSGKNTWWDNINYVWAHNFSQNLMDYRTTSEEAGAGIDTGHCKESGVYASAKAGYAAIRANSYAKAQLESSFPESINRLAKWAIANGEELNTSTGVFTPINEKGRFMDVSSNSADNGTTMIAVLATSVALITAAGFVFLKKKKSL